MLTIAYYAMHNKDYKTFVLDAKVPSFLYCNKIMNLTEVCFFSSIFFIVQCNFVGSLMKIKNEQVCSRQV